MMPCEPACSICLRLREAAVRVVGDGGIETLSHERLERAAGLVEGQAVEHYPNAATCMHEAYEEVWGHLTEEIADAFSDGLKWGTAFALARTRMLTRLAADPVLARFCFVEAPRGDRVLRRLRDVRRRRLIGCLADRQAGSGATVSPLQIELLVGGTFHEISTTIAAGRAADLPALEPRLGQLVALFDPAGADPSPVSPARSAVGV
jgi:hypothetical protein